MHIVRELEEFSRNLNHASNKVSEKIKNIVNKISDLPILSYFLKKHPEARNGKSRTISLKNK